MPALDYFHPVSAQRGWAAALWGKRLPKLIGGPKFEVLGRSPSDERLSYTVRELSQNRGRLGTSCMPPSLKLLDPQRRFKCHSCRWRGRADVSVQWDCREVRCHKQCLKTVSGPQPQRWVPANAASEISYVKLTKFSDTLINLLRNDRRLP
jgi:hypothetical protein